VRHEKERIFFGMEALPPNLRDFVAVAPDVTSTLGTYITHIDLNKAGRSVSWSGAAIGFVFVTAFVAIVCAASGAIYNRLAH